MSEKRGSETESAADTTGRARAAIDHGIDELRHGAERVKEGAHAAAERVRERAQAGAERVREGAHAAAEKFGEAAEDFAYDVRQVVKRHPGAAIAVSLLVGVAIGSILTRRRD
jgi:ElaB/YqjD/DUF883 family membrane-anchored ribosome-binding protein